VGIGDASAIIADGRVTDQQSGVLMRTSFLPGIVFAASLTIFAQTSNPSNLAAVSKSPETCVVSGRVIAAGSGNPLRSAHIALESESYDKKFDVLAATTGDDGHFVLKNVPAGRYRFLATKPGYVKHYYEGGERGGTILALQPGQELNYVLFRMTQSAVITGQVNDEAGEPLVNVRVVVLRWPTEEELEDEDASEQGKRHPFPAGFAETDDRGEYRVFGLKPGQYFVKASDSEGLRRERLSDETDIIRQVLGAEHAPVYYPGVVKMGQAQPLVLRAGDEVQADFAMTRARTVEVAGRVLGPDGQPAADAQVSVGDREAVYGFENTVMSEEDGIFRLKGVPPGSYTLTAYLFQRTKIHRTSKH